MGIFRNNDGRTEKPTGKRRSEARQKGQIARSQELPFSIVFLGLIWVLGTFGGTLVKDLSEMLRSLLTRPVPREFGAEQLQQLMTKCSLDVAKALFIFTLTTFLLSVGGNAAQGGLTLTAYRLRFRFSNLNPVSGLKRLLPGRSSIELLKNLMHIGLVSYVAYGAFSDVKSELPRFILMSPIEIFIKTGQLLYRVAFRCGLLFLVIGVADFFWRRHEFEEDLKMTKQEVKDEAKNAENPEIRGMIRRKQREVARRLMAAAVRKADVVITNPTHYAVALSYQRESMMAPVVVAKGQDYTAQRIRQIAEESKVPLVENKTLAQSLYKLVEVGEPIPGSLYKAVAEVLAYVYRLKSMRL
ncbi:MAG TPA: flagellar biosynthesis protein FlhB [Terriglobia bacterium]|nr:flagellar biosynthesis protein FlhB [Terriglobia bacterium]